MSDLEEISTAVLSASSATACGCEAVQGSFRKRVDVLVVDDNKLIADTTSAILSRFGFCAVTAYDGVTALRLAAETSPEILLSDVMMPVVNGVELAISVRKILPLTAILLFSGQAATKDILEDARRQGHTFAIVNKPIHPEELVRHLNHLRQISASLT